MQVPFTLDVVARSGQPGEIRHQTAQPLNNRRLTMKFSPRLRLTLIAGAALLAACGGNDDYVAPIVP